MTFVDKENQRNIVVNTMAKYQADNGKELMLNKQVVERILQANPALEAKVENGQGSLPMVSESLLEAYVIACESHVRKLTNKIDSLETKLETVKAENTETRLKLSKRNRQKAEALKERISPRNSNQQQIQSF